MRIRASRLSGDFGGGWPRASVGHPGRNVNIGANSAPQLGVELGGAPTSAVVLHNDPEVALRIAKRFPEADVRHLFHNLLVMSPRTRNELRAGSVQLFAVSDYVARWVEDSVSLESGSITVVHNGVDSNVFTPGATAGKDSVFNIGFLGRPSIEKAPDVLLEATAQLERLESVQVSIAGANHVTHHVEDAYQRQLDSTASRISHQGGQVNRLGPLARRAVPDFLRSLDVLVVPSRWEEPCALVILEAMSSGLAVVASRTGGTPELIGDAGLLFERDDIDGLRGLLELLRREPRTALGTRRRRADARAGVPLEQDVGRTNVGSGRSRVSHFALVNPPGEYHSTEVGGAVSTVNLNLARALQKAGHQVTVFSALPVQTSPIVDVPIAPLVDVLRISRVKRKIAHWETVRRSYHASAYGVHLRSLMREFKRSGSPIDVVLTHNDLRAGPHIRRWLPSARWVPWMHNEAHNLPAGVVSGIATASLIVCVSEYIRTWTINRYDLDERHVVASLNGVDTDFFHPGDRLEATAGPLKVLYVGRLDHDKGVDTLVDSVGVLRRGGRAVDVTVLGSRWWYGNEAQLDDWYAGGVISQTIASGGTWQPHASRDVTANVFREHDVVGVLSRSQDPAPLVTLEAMASGCALIASNRGGIPELAGSAGVVVTPGDTAAVTATLAKWCDDRASLIRAKRESLEQAKGMTWDHTVARFLDALETSPR